MATILKARYVGRIERARDTLLLLDSARAKLERESHEYIVQTRSKLAQKVRSLRRKARRTSARCAEQHAQRYLVRELFSLSQKYHECLSHAHSECLELSLKIAEAVVGMQVPDLAQSLSVRISNALTELRDNRASIVEVNPADLTEVSQSLAKRRSTLKLEVHAVEEIDRGKARIVTAVGSVRVDWQGHLAQLKTDLRAALRRDRTSGNEV